MRYFGVLLLKLYKISGSKYFLDISPEQFFANWFFQKILGINGDIPFSTHYTSSVKGYKNIRYDKTNLTLLKSFAVSGGCYFGIADGSILEIGNDTIWAWNLNIQTANHDFNDRKKYILKNIKIGNNCWIGGNVTILPGVELGDNVTVGANSVVTKSFPSNCVIAGVPAKIIRTIES